uniref:Polyprotein n=1 Tax=Hymenopteran flavi-related virus TaxID=2822563 RepID=A0A8A6RP54_9FLAV|nr:polyprotein [Hymenopteran flavi-related virus]
MDGNLDRTQKFSGMSVAISRASDDDDPAFRRSSVGFFGTLNLSRGLDASDQWVHAAWWAGINVYYTVNDSIYLSTIGGYCQCSVLISADAGDHCTMLFAKCRKHENVWKVEHFNGPEVMNYLRTGRKDEAMTVKLNGVLNQWYVLQPWRRDLSVKKTVETVKTTWMPSINWTRKTEYVEHHESIIADALAAIASVYDSFKQTKTAPQSLAKRVLDDWSDTVSAVTLSKERERIDQLAVETTVNVASPEEDVGETVGLYKYVLGYDKPCTTVAPRWDWLTWKHNMLVREHSSVSEVIRCGKVTDNMASKLNYSAWESYEKLGRVALPKRTAEGAAYISRGGFKMQQLHEADPNFFEDVKVILDPCAGYGGFAEYYSAAMASKAPKVYIMSSLYEKGHRIPSGELRQATRSNVDILLATTVEHADRGNIKDPRCSTRIKAMCERVGGVDLLIIDAGEYSSDGERNHRFWYKKDMNKVDFLTAVVNLSSTINAGGKMCLKVNGLWHGVQQMVHTLSKQFAKVKAIKLGTTSLASPEWYLLLEGKQLKESDVRRASELIGAICDEQQYHYLLMQQIMRIKGRGWKVRKRHDWFMPGSLCKVFEVKTRSDNKPGGVKIEIEAPEGRLFEEWDPGWDERLDKFTQLLRQKKMRWTADARRQFDNIYSAGTITRKRRSQQPKNTKNGLISGFSEKVWGLDDLNSTFCHTQNTDAWKDASIKKRLDVNPGHMDHGALRKIYRAMKLLTSKFGEEMKGKCRILEKEEVLLMINAQGSTGALDEGHTLKDFMNIHQDWYEKCLEQINMWRCGKPTASYFTCRPKNEPKQKKCVDDGRIVVDTSALPEYSEQGHRFIQFADSLTRLSHYVLLGDVLRVSSKNKLYKGTINGTPPMYVGRVMRSIWDSNSLSDDKEVNFGHNPDSDQFVESIREQVHGSEPMAVCLDYSGWDTTVTLEERLIEADDVASFYPSELRSTIMNCFKEMSCPITVDDDGNVWLRAGQRGSGELFTSYGNTKLVAANTAVAVSEATGMSLEEVCETVMKITYLVGFKQCQPVNKVVEVTRFGQMSDGDDTFMITKAEWAKAIVDNIEEALTLQNKKIRSGQEGGAKLCHRFDEIEFCSHSYKKVAIADKKWWLPFRPISDIFSKMRMTLKVNTSRWDPTNNDCVTVTRSKILSYLILYPHIRSVRYHCLSLLAITGDGTLNWQEFKRRWEWQEDIGRMTAIRALKSVYRISNLNEVSYINYRIEAKYLLTLKRNTLLTRRITRINVREYVSLMFRFILSMCVKDSDVICLDETYARHFCNYVITGSHEKTSVNTIIERNIRLKQLCIELSSTTAPGTGHRGFNVAVKRAIDEENRRSKILRSK